MKPKLWQGATAVGEAFTRARQALDMPVNTSYGTELREDGTQGRVMSKACGEHDAVYREANPTGEPFLCTWQGEEVFFPDKTMSPSKQRFSLEGTGYTAFVGNSVFVGDGFMVGLVATSTTLGQPSTVAPLLMRLPRPGKPMTAAQFAEADPGARRKASILLPGISIEYLTTIYVVPMGWKNKDERYTFAVITTTLADITRFPKPTAIPRIWTGSTGAYVPRRAEDAPVFGAYGPLAAAPDLSSLDWEWTAPSFGPGEWKERRQYDDYGYAHPYLASSFWSFWHVQSVHHSRVTCTGPGRLECVVVKTEADNYTFRYAAGTMVPYRVRLASWPTAESPWPTGAPGWAAGPGEFVLTADPGFPGAGSGDYYEPPFGPFNVSTGFIYETPLTLKLKEYEPRRPTVYTIRSTDFGATWSMRHEEGMESTTLDTPPEGPFETDYDPEAPFRIDGNPDLARYWLVQYMPWGYPHVTSNTVNVFFGDAGYPWTFAVRSAELKRPVDPIPWPVQSERTNRGITLRDPFERFTMINTGRFTFLVAPSKEYGENVTLPAGVTTGDFVEHLLHVPELERTHHYAYPAKSIPNPIDVLAMYRRDLDGGFERIPWPLDSVVNTATNKLFTVEFWHAQRRLVYGETPTPPMSWACTGEGKFAVFLVRADARTASGSINLVSATVLMVATTDGGATWTTMELTNADYFDQTVVVQDGRDKSIVYAEPTAKGKLQLMRISADFTKVTKYGAPYSPGRGGLVNFQRYVHPGLPGLYDEPKETP